MADYRAGDVLGERFEVLGVLGRGGLATVYLVDDRERGQRVALKMLHGHLAHDPAVQRQLQREVQAASMLRHEATLGAWAIHRIDGVMALTMPFHPGRSLAEAVASEGPLSAEALTETAVRLAGALSEAHRQGILHRDVTPANVMVEGHGARAVLTDFGLARLDQLPASRSTGALGTAGYAAPEVYDGVRADPRSDLYSLGATLWYAATGQAPFEADSPAAALKRQLADERPDLAHLRPDLPAHLVRAIESLLDPEPGKRPASAQQVAQALSEGRAPRTLPAPPVAGATTTALVPQAALPEGPWTVYVEQRHRRKHRRHRDSDEAPAAIARAVADAAGLPAEAVAPAEVLGLGRYKIVDGVDDHTAGQLAQVARAHGLTARCVHANQREGFLRHILAFWPFLIAAIWVVFPFLADAIRGSDMFLIPFNVLATIALAVLGPRLGAYREREPLPVAYRRDLSRQLSEGFSVGEPTAAPALAPTAPRETPLLQRALAALDGLDAALTHDDLPEAVRADLRRTARALRQRAEALGAQLAEQAHPQRGPTAEIGWIQARLTRLETLERSGEPVDLDERARLEETLAQAEQLDATEQAHTTWRTAATARLLEIAAAAVEARRAITEDPEPAHSAARLLTELESQTEHLERTRAELDEARLKRARSAALKQRG
ncbi:MAG: protein kinase [Alphaproteobacteria bacterium]|nr:protein kinase [Alphaproteobacteria bacterium]